MQWKIQAMEGFLELMGFSKNMARKKWYGSPEGGEILNDRVPGERGNAKEKNAEKEEWRKGEGSQTVKESILHLTLYPRQALALYFDYIW